MKRLAFYSAAAALFAGALALLISGGEPRAQYVNTTSGKLTASSGNKAAASANIQLGPTAGLMYYVCGFNVQGLGATSASAILVTLAGLNGGTMTWALAIPAGVTVQVTPLQVTFEPCQPATALNTAIALSVPSFGTGNTNATSTMWGYSLPY